MKVKLCGFTEAESVKTAIATGCDFLGFVFFDKSPRNISPQDAANLAHLIPQNIAKVAVVVNPDFEFLTEIVEKFSPDFFQFHGDEDVEFLLKVRRLFPQIKIIKAFKIKDEADLKAVDSFIDYCDSFLFDGQNPGSGKKFNWQILQNLDLKKDWFLSGGININNLAEVINATQAQMIDVSSGIEEIHGKKSPKLIIEFMNKVRSLC